MTAVQISVRAAIALAIIVLLYNTLTVNYSGEVLSAPRQEEGGNARCANVNSEGVHNITQVVTYTLHATETVKVLEKTIETVTVVEKSVETIKVNSVPDYYDETNNEGIRPPPQPKHAIDYQVKLNNEQRQSLQKLQTNQTERRIQNIKSLYGMTGPRSWLQHFESLPDELLFPLTKFSQRAIYDHQHPASCEDKLFVRLPVRLTNGVGAAIHYASEALGSAMMDGRIAVYDPNNPPLQRHVEEENGNKNPFGRLFEEITSCQAFANEHNTKNLEDYSNLVRPTLPILGQAMLEQFPDITPNALALWARSQHVAYLLRLRPEALAYLAEHRLDQDAHVGYTNMEEGPVPFPLPQKSWSMHVRHGDKGREMRLVPFHEFALAAEKYAMQNPIESRKWAFVSSDDPEVFEEMKKVVSIKDTDTVSNKQWHWFMSKMERSTQVQFETLSHQTNKTETTLNWLSQLFLAMECDGFVGTRGSNWNSLIEELRGIWAPAARGPYLDVSRERDWMNYPA